MKKSSNQRKVLLVFSIIMLLISIIGATYAFFTANITGNENSTTISLTGGSLTINYISGKNINVTGTIPSNNAVDYKTFSLIGNNNTDLAMQYWIKLNVTKNTFSKNAISYTLDNTATGGTPAPKIDSPKGLPNGKGEYTIGQGEFYLEQEVEHNYTLQLYFLEQSTPQNQDQGATFHAYIEITAQPPEAKASLNDTILANNSLKENPNFNKTEPYEMSYNDSSPWSEPVSMPISLNSWVGTSYYYDSSYGGYFLAGELTQGVTADDPKIGLYTLSSTAKNASGQNLYQITGYESHTETTISITAAIKYGRLDPNWSSSSGLYSTDDDYGTSYYFRGKYDDLNNNVIFAGYQWKIIRIDGNNNIRMIYNGLCENNNCDINDNKAGDNASLTRSSFNTQKNDNTFVGYIYGLANQDTYALTHTNTNSSVVKNIVDEFYDNLSDDAKDQIVKTIYCNDRQLQSDIGGNTTGTGTGISQTNYAAYHRLKTQKNPTLKCANTNDRLELNAGLITADEVAFAGGKQNNTNYYLYLKSHQDYWTMTPYYFYGSSAQVLAVNMYGGLESNSTTNNLGVRPVITINPTTSFTGKGSMSDPYIIEY